MKICLINPCFPLSLWDFSYSRDIDGNIFPFPPLALATLAALTPGEYEVVICDENVKPVDFDTEADIVGITGYHIQKERVYQIADSFRSKGKTVAIGGPLVQKSNLDECTEHADIVFLGEAEYTWPSFIRDFQSGNAQPLYAQDGFVDLVASPAPRFELLELSVYSTAIIETSRGCPHSCEFCEIPIRLGKRPRNKSVEQVMTEIRSLYALGTDSIFIIDDNFFGNRKRALALLAEIERFVKSIDYRVYFSCQFTIDISRDEEILILMNKANFRRVFVGIETPRKLSLTMARKNQNTKVDLLDAVRRIQSNNIIVWGSFIVGFDSDDTNIFNEQLKFIQAASIP
ncbi:MAG: radical SAM protein, partial [Nitrospirae bacterium]|nr:radical SAM protein [Nitrospirota bacterium]